MQVKRKRPEEASALSLRLQRDREDLEKNMTLRRDKKQETLTRRMLEHERAATAALVEKQSSEMLDLINEKRSEYMQVCSKYNLNLYGIYHNCYLLRRKVCTLTIATKSS